MEPFIPVIILLLVVVFGYLLAKVKRTAKGNIPKPLTTHPSNSFRFSELQDDPNFPHAGSIHTKIRGVTKENPDRTKRQRIIRTCCKTGDALLLVREPNNPFDSNAIQVRRLLEFPENVQQRHRLGEQIGYISRELAEDLAPRMDKEGFILFAWIMEVTGGEHGESLGVNIQIEKYRPAKQHRVLKSRQKRKNDDGEIYGRCCGTKYNSRPCGLRLPLSL
jgi:HIRAN domain